MNLFIVLVYYIVVKVWVSLVASNPRLLRLFVLLFLQLLASVLEVLWAQLQQECLIVFEVGESVLVLFYLALAG